MLDFKYQEGSRIQEDGLVRVASFLMPYVKTLKQNLEQWKSKSSAAFMDLPADMEARLEVKRIGNKLKNDRMKYVVVVGIGGSNLGTKAVYEASRGFFDADDSKQKPELLFLETLSHENMRDVLAKLSECETADEFAVVVVSKSGSTTETISNAAVLYNVLNKQHPEVSSRFVCISDEGSPLWLFADHNQFLKLPIPEKVGGRYSVFSPVGLLPLVLAGVDIDALLRGAEEMRHKAFSEDFSENPAALSAMITFFHLQNGKSTHDLFVFDPLFENVGKWWRQLTAESLGKEYDLDGTPVETGILPIVSVGSTDLHSVGQLYLGGPKNILTTFVSVENASEYTSVPSGALFTQLLLSVETRTFNGIMHAILKGVKTAYKERNMPYMEVIFPENSAENMGAFMQMKMMETVYLGRLMNVNPFNQPNVEEYKSETRRLLNL